MGFAAGAEIERLVELLAKLPGLGPRSARRAVLTLVRNREGLMDPLAAALEAVRTKVRPCRICGNLDTDETCAVCRDPRRD
ncbi:MAG: recombination protein RecR, partial [Alphaproteobacteria bacterium]|nr:recombination protein RecR [Alphaproteobacteria bacterium]MDX5369862.1 recombination protein RecR [Alphaproteobacteria bacterium]MDX5464478.1 recombination protein RecR [Alphaproteobacteria bacterium]